MTIPVAASADEMRPRDTLVAKGVTELQNGGLILCRLSTDPSDPPVEIIAAPGGKRCCGGSLCSSPLSINCTLSPSVPPSTC